MGQITETYTKATLQSDLDAFCDGLWDFTVSQFVPEMMAGEETTGAPSFLLFPYILEDGGSILFSPPGRGKSNSALVWAVSIDAGISDLWKVHQCPVMYINLERSAISLRRRLANINILLGLPAKRPLLTINARGKSLSSIAPAVQQAIKGYGIKLLILDSISRAGYGDLNEGTTANNIIDTLNNLCPTWLALGHTSRASDEHLYGSILADAGADIIIQLRSQVAAGKLGIGYEITKANDIPPQKQKIYAFEFEDWKLTNIRLATSQEFPEIEGKARVDMLTSVLDFILAQESGDATATEIANELGFNRANISSLLSKRTDKFIKTRKVKTSQYYGVLDNTQTLL